MIDETTFSTQGNGAGSNRADEMFKAYRRQLKNRRGRALAYTVIGSLILHASFVLAVAFVPAVSDALHLVNMFQGADFADETYNRTRINDTTQEVVAIVNANDLFQYPESYFTPYHGTRLTPEPVNVFNDAFIVSTAPNFTPEPLFPVPTPVPTPRPTPVAPVVKPTPTTTPANANTNAAIASSTNANNTNAANNAKEEIAADATEPTEQEAQKANEKLGFPKINSRPFKDLLARGKTLHDAKQIDLSAKLEMEIEAVRAKDGSLTDVKIVRATGSPEARQLALDFISALSDSRVLSRLEGMNRLNMAVTLDDEKVSTEIKSEMTSTDEATTMSKGLNGLLFFAILKREGGEEAVQIYKNIKLSARDKQVVVNFAMPRAEAGTLISTQLAKPS
ncbi:MAG: hypothetical protein MSG64_00330 [Pyrinomonadaceae bacterium MAG19_C2-C3]|nr:hypothetical protein [Pyrinomonadaceae bacterium MAG19_C2-C3]